jgi:hypothetical protein
VVPFVDSLIAAVFMRIVSELALMAIVFWRTVVATEHPVISAAIAVTDIVLVFICALLRRLRQIRFASAMITSAAFSPII